MSASFVQGFFVRQPAWHGQGVVIPEAFDLTNPDELREAIRLAGHDRQAVERPVFVPQPGTIYVQDAVEAANLRNQGVPAERIVTWDEAARATAEASVGEHMSHDDDRVGRNAWKAIVDERTGRVHNITKGSYEIVQFEVLWELVQAFAGRDDVCVETAGVLRQGAVGWVLGVVDEHFVAPGDTSPVFAYFSASTTHDGSGAARIDCHSTRIVCANTFSWAQAQAEQQGGSFGAGRDGQSGATFTFRHTKTVADRIEQAKGALGKLRETHRAFGRLAEELARTPVTDEHLKYFVNQFVALPEGDVVSERVRRNVEKAREDVWGIINGPTIAEAGIRNTAWGLLQTGVEYLDHVRRYRSKETYFTRNTFRPDTLKSHLEPFVRELAAIDPSELVAAGAGKARGDEVDG